MKKPLSALLVILFVLSVCPWETNVIAPARAAAAHGPADSALVKKTIKPTKIKLNKTKLSVNIGGTATLKATISPNNATDKTVKWSSSDKKIATVSSSGVVKGIKAGKVTITAKTSNGKKAKCAVTVKAVNAPQGEIMTSMASEVAALVNSERAKVGAKALTVDADLTAAANIRAKEIVTLFSHTRPDGTSCTTVSNKVMGENIAMGYTNASRVMDGWMNSQGHRENILRSYFGSIGVGAYRYNGTMYWVQLFGY